jgi:predicted metal-dependent phosphoesterase TrpH
MRKTIYSKADTHMHTTYSDGAATPAEMVEHVVAHTDLKVIAVTDHDTAEGALIARRYVREAGIPLEVIIGQEVTTDEGDVVGLFLRETLPAFRTAAQAVQAIHSQGGLAIAVHPFSRWITLGNMTGVGQRLAVLPLDGVEIRNGFPTNWGGNAYARWFNRRTVGHAELGGSDSHVPFTIGQAHTLFPGETAADFRRAVVARTTIAAGPLWTPASLVQLVPALARHGFPSRVKEPAYEAASSRDQHGQSLAVEGSERRLTV